MPNLDNKNKQLSFIHLIDDPIVTYSNSQPTFPNQSFDPWWIRVVGKFENGFQYAQPKS